MPPATKKARTIRYLETFDPKYEMKCLECGRRCPDNLRLFTYDDWMSIHADIFHRDPPPSRRRAPAQRKVLPMMAERTTPEEYRKLKKEARRHRQFKGIKDKGQGASLKHV